MSETQYPVCHACGHGDMLDVMVLSSVGPITRVCRECGANNRPKQSVAFRRWHGQVTWMVDPAWQAPPPRVIRHPGEAASTRPPTITVWCGPPADRPLPPTPEEILACAQWLTAPGPGRADLSDHRVYSWAS